MTAERFGVLLCLLSAAAFSSSTVFGRFALDDGAGVMTILAVRYSGAALLFLLLLRLTGQVLPGWQAIAQLLALGASALSAQAVLFYSALARLDAGLVTLLLYTFPAIVAVGAIALGREAPNRRKLAAVGVATAGTALVVGGDATLAADSFGVLLALGAAVGAAGWLLIGDRLLREIPPLVVSALTAAGAALALWPAGLVVDGIRFEFGPTGWWAILGIVLVATGLAISTSMAGMVRVGPTVASVLLTVEVPLAVTWAALLLGEYLQPLQLAGGALVVLAVLLLQVGGPGWLGRAAAGLGAALARRARGRAPADA